MKKVSIIIPCYNKGKYVKDAIESALHQTYQNIEIVCVNDASTDDSGEILKEFSKKYEIKLIENENNMGVVYSRNCAIEASSGDYILPLDADDTIEPSYVEKAAEILNSRPDIGVVYCQYRYFGKSNRKIILPNVTKEYLLYSSCISSCSMFRRTDFLSIGGYKGFMKNGCEDWELWLNFYENEFKFYLINEYLLNYRKIKDKTRTNTADNDIVHIKQNLLKEHLNLYLSDENFIDKVFNTNYSLYKKYKKYKNLFNYTIMISAIIIFVLLIIIIWS
ncbi:glycosyltransferase family 2 protein [bacterium]|nr:glycosyltransferase family 2 protein [bacterium]